MDRENSNKELLAFLDAEAKNSDSSKMVTRDFVAGYKKNKKDYSFTFKCRFPTSTDAAKLAFGERHVVKLIIRSLCVDFAAIIRNAKGGKSVQSDTLVEKRLLSYPKPVDTADVLADAAEKAAKAEADKKRAEKEAEFERMRGILIGHYAQQKDFASVQKALAFTKADFNTFIFGLSPEQGEHIFGGEFHSFRKVVIKSIAR